ncbi:ribosome small subunit-dependent GTPase A [Elusimicrobiota bacterium]
MKQENRLAQLGWDSAREAEAKKYQSEGLSPARVIEVHRAMVRVDTGTQVINAESSGRMVHDAQDSKGFPVVGDWVMVHIRGDSDRSIIHYILPRRSKLSRKVAGKKTREQVIVANIDTIFLVTSANQEFNARRIERYITTIYESGVSAVIVINKTDVNKNYQDMVLEARLVSLGAPVIAVSAKTGEGLEKLDPYLIQNKTVGFVGSSGVGKSTIINRLLGQDIQEVMEIRQDDAHGRHATISRHLFLLARGASVIDTPGMRELQLWESDEGLSQVFHDIDALAEGCKFHDCRHGDEPGCAVKQALENNSLDEKRFFNYLKLKKELAHLERRQGGKQQSNSKKRWKAIHKSKRQKKKFLDK